MKSFRGRIRVFQLMPAAVDRSQSQPRAKAPSLTADWDGRPIVFAMSGSRQSIVRLVYLGVAVLAALIAVPGPAAGWSGNAYVPNYGESTVAQFGVGSGGALTALGPATGSVGIRPIGDVISPDGKSL